jgi:BCD family chlorophyll transporter-like MFS transporter
MMDMTIPGKVGLFIGAWGAASALARLMGSFTTAAIRDLARLHPDAATIAYAAAFFAQVVFLAISLLILRRIDVTRFKKDAAEAVFTTSVVERAALSTEG